MDPSNRAGPAPFAIDSIREFYPLDWRKILVSALYMAHGDDRVRVRLHPYRCLIFVCNLKNPKKQNTIHNLGYLFAIRRITKTTVSIFHISWMKIVLSIWYTLDYVRKFNSMYQNTVKAFLLSLIPKFWMKYKPREFIRMGFIECYILFCARKIRVFHKICPKLRDKFWFVVNV